MSAEKTGGNKENVKIMDSKVVDGLDNSGIDTPRDMANFLRRALFNHKDFDSRHVVVQVIDRKVFLEGFVMSSGEKEKIDKFIRDFPFVEAVSSYITFRK